MTVRLAPEEAWAAIDAAHTGIFTTLRRDGWPVSLPVWFVAIDGCVYIRTPARSNKVARVRNDGRASFLVESGERWAELRAVHLTGNADILLDEGRLASDVNERFARKYDLFRTSREAMPDATRNHYQVAKVIIHFVPDERIVSWDNSKLEIG